MKKFLFLLLVLCACVAASPDDSSGMTPLEREIFDLTNQAREAHGVAPLLVDPMLVSAAREHSIDMRRREFFAHVNPDGLDSADRLAAAYGRSLERSGENLWRGAGYGPEILAAAVVEGWMNSPGHRGNLLRVEFTHLGVGVELSGDEAFVTQDFSGSEVGP